MVSAQEVNQQIPLPIELGAILNLFAELRLANFRIDVRHVQQVRDVCAAAAVSGTLVQDRTHLRNWIAPIVCHSVAEQREFARIFDVWAAATLSLPPARPPGGKHELLDTLHRAEVSAGRWLWLIAIPAVLLGIVAWAYLASVAESRGVPAPLPVPDEPITIWLKWGGWALALFVAGVALYVGSWYRLAHRVLVRESASSPQALTSLSVETRAQKLFHSLDVTRLSSACRRRDVKPGEDLDEAATVDNTIRHGGFFSPVFASQRVFPEYLALIDRTSHEDQEAAFVDELLSHLTKRGVAVARYYFDRDPRLCFPQRADDDTATLDLLASRFRDHRLLIFADSHVLANPATGGLAVWVQELERWPVRALLVPGGTRWTRFERRLADHIPILPATLEGIASLLDGLHGDRRPRRSNARAVPIPLPEAFAVDVDRWVGPAPPPEEESASMVAALRGSLTPDEFTWLSACAVYPGMHWNLTLALGYGLEQHANAPLVTTSSVASLAQLPWFRHGYMPDWLRRRLVDGLPRTENRTIRRILNALLMTAVRGGTGDLALQIVAERSNTFERLAGYMRRLAARRGTCPAEWRDQIFVRFMSRRRVRPLSVRVPEAWSLLWGGGEETWGAVTILRNRATRNTRLLAALMYPLNLAIIPFLVSRTDTDRYLRFNACQALLVSLILFVPILVMMVIRTTIGMPDWVLAVWLVTAYLAFKAWRGQPARIPLVSRASLVWTRSAPVWHSAAPTSWLDRTGPPWEELGIGLQSFFGTTIAVLFTPTSLFRNMRREGNIAKPLLYYVMCGWLQILAKGIWEPSELNSSVGLGQTAPISLHFIVNTGFLVLGAFFGSGLNHLMLKLFGGQNYPFPATFRAVAYASGGAMLFGPLPVVGPVMGAVWVMVTTIIALKHTQDISTFRAVLVMLSSIVVIALALIGYSAYLGSGI
jgi:uncharacterized membrane protein